jgi:hypothetical protein
VQLKLRNKGVGQYSGIVGGQFSVVFSIGAAVELGTVLLRAGISHDIHTITFSAAKQSLQDNWEEWSALIGTLIAENTIADVLAGLGETP